MDKKFIIVNDKSVADKMIAAGFVLLSQIGCNYTFINDVTKNFTFEKNNIDKSKYHFSNILSM